MLHEHIGLFVEPKTTENVTCQPNKIYTSRSQSVLQGDDNNEFGFWTDKENTVLHSAEPQVKSDGSKLFHLNNIKHLSNTTSLI